MSGAHLKVVAAIGVGLLVMAHAVPAFFLLVAAELVFLGIKKAIG